MLKSLIIYTVFALLIASIIIGVSWNKPAISPSISPSPTPALSSATTPIAISSVFGEPVSNAKQRITKKPFGIYVSPGHSPINPEKFTGYHTGTDFEIFSGEENTDIQIFTICDDPLLEKKTATGYGGVVVQKCSLNNQPITVIYGHLKLSSISAIAGQQFKTGDKLAILGAPYSAETGGERKHLHLGIHKGADIVLFGYVQNQSELSGWFNFIDYFK